MIEQNDREKPGTFWQAEEEYAREVAKSQLAINFPNTAKGLYDKPKWKPDITDEQKEQLLSGDKAARFNDGKLKWSLVDFESLHPMVRVLEFGAKKYSPENWKKGLNKKAILESMMRHLTALMDGQVFDNESGIDHMGHIQCNAMFYNYMVRTGKGS